MNRISQAVNHLNPAKDVAGASGRLEEIKAAVLRLLPEASEAWLDLETICTSEDLKGLGATREELLLALQSSQFEIENSAVRVKMPEVIRVD